jgi:hypothetical protein
MGSHSLVYGFDNYTQTGIFTTTKISNQWTIQLAFPTEPTLRFGNGIPAINRLAQ